MVWPGEKRFAFSVFDDTDRATLENARPVYDLLADLGLRTTKSVWVSPGKEEHHLAGMTCEDEAYLTWLLDLKARGFEIALHNVSYGTSSREETIHGFDRFRQLFGHDPRTLANHAGTRESIYWYDARLTGPRALLYNMLTGFRSAGRARGHVEGDPLFWGDICRERVRYVRSFVFPGIDTIRSCPWMPYHDPARPYVNSWFASSPGGSCATFAATISEREQDRLEEDGGACIMYTHFANGFYADGRLNPRFRQLIERLAKKDGCFLPVGDLLDHIADQRGVVTITPAQRSRMESRWLLRKILVGTE
ncbi:MAG: hypothetical protein FJY88_00860 [Candidatus Eisenbacteria bacterium]|nr:hypothetical protein [Candidatus Eisenbacteria bacterium]